MLMLIKECIFKRQKFLFFKEFQNFASFCNDAKGRNSFNDESTEFRVLDLFPTRKSAVKGKKVTFKDSHVQPPRETRMPINQDWPSVWPTAKCFRPSVVPLPVYQGYDQKRAPPGKYANAELMKIPNFLHLTGPAIKRHCQAIKRFCTSWPEGLKSHDDCEKNFPVEIITSDYCHASPTIRDERSRIVTLTVKLKSLNLDYHGRDKLLRLVGERYNVLDDVLTLVGDRCPLKKQNYDYLIYLLVALHNESWATEPWEHEKTEADMEKFFFEGSRIEKHIIETLTKVKSSCNTEEIPSETDIKGSEEVDLFRKSVSELINEGESDENIQIYKESVLKALNLENTKAIV